MVTLDAEAIAAMVDQLGDMAAALNAAEPQDLADLYEALRLELKYDAEQNLIEVTARPTLRVNSARVRGGTRTSITRLELESDGVGRAP